MTNLLLACISLLSLLCSTALGQDTPKKALTHDVYDSWNKISGETISNNGKRVMYSLEPQEGDSRLVIYNSTTGSGDTIQRGMNPKFSDDSRYGAFFTKPFFAATKKAKIAKKKADELPKDSLGIIEFEPHASVIIPRVKAFAFPEKGSGWIAYQCEKDPPPGDSTSRSKTGGRKNDIMTDAAADEKEKKDEKGTTLVLRRLATGDEFRFTYVSDFLFAKNGKRILFASTGNDSSAAPGVFVFDTEKKYLDTISIGKGKYTMVAWDESGNQAAFIADRDTTKAKQRFYQLFYWNGSGDSAVVVGDTLTPGFAKRWLVSENARPSFSKDERRLFFGTAPIPTPEDTTFNEEETAKLDIWNWQDDLLQPQQLKNLDSENKRSYLAVINLATRKFVQLGDADLPTIVTGSEGNAPVALGLSDKPYRKRISWEAVPTYDVYVVDVESGIRTKVLEGQKGSPSISPAGMYLYWYDAAQRNWFAIPTAHPTKPVIVTSTIKVPLYNELHDMPDDPSSYGALGWTENDKALLVYDRYDIWQTDPTGSMPALCITAGSGRKERTSYRYVKLDPEERFINPKNPLFLRTFDLKDKSSGFATAMAGKADPPLKLCSGPYDHSAPVKGRNDSTLLLTRGNFTQFPDLYLTAMDCRLFRRISDANPQQKSYLWGSVELFSWKAGDGKPIDGLLYKPESFDSKKKYPVIVYFYERNSDLLHRYFPPAPSASTINVSLYVSRGYLVFIPDIRYRIGSPGQSAMDAIIPGVRKLIISGIADSTRIGIQGQSWGGYQVAFLITRSTMFRAAMAGAAVSNMTSAYGGIRWESGVSRMFQYEKAQSRIGATLWENPKLFIENSPLFRADRVQTPLLLMNNDADGAVPWYQGIEFFTALRRLGRQVWMLNYNNEAHNLVQRRNRKDLSIRMLQFFDHFLKGEPMPLWMKKGIPATEKWKTMGYEASTDGRAE